MRNIGFVLVMMVGLLTLGMPPVEAGVTCKLVPSWCPPPAGGGGDGDTNLPEPATLAVLAVGACAAGLAARRRNKK